MLWALLLATLIILWTAALAIYRFQFLDVHVVINRGVVYSILMVMITVIYLLLGTVVGSFVQSLSLGLTPLAVAVLTTLIVVVVALPLRDAIQRLVDRFFLRSRVDYRQLLQDYSRALTTPVPLPRLLATVADQVEAVFHPTGLAVALAGPEQGYRVMLCRGELALQPVWQEGATFAPEHPVPVQLTAWNRSLYLPRHASDLPMLHKQDWEQLQESGAQLFVPMQMGGRLCGWLVLGPKLSELSYTRQDLDFLSALMDQSCVALENARLYAAVTRERDRARRLYQQTDAALARRVEELTTLGEISRQLTSTLDMQQVMDLMLERAMQATHADCGAFALCDPENHRLHLLAEEGYASALDRYRAKPWFMDESITGRVARTGVSALLPDITTDPDYVAAVPTIRSQLSVPVTHEDRVIGVITLESDQEAAFTEEHLRFIELLAEHAVIGLNNAQLFQQVMEARDQLHAVLNSTHDLVVVLDTLGQLVLTNRRVHEMFGRRVEEWLRSVSLPDAIQVLDSRALPFAEVDVGNLAEVIRLVQESPSREMDIAFSFRRDGQRRYIEGTASPMLGAAGEVMGWVTVMREVTQRKELERFRKDLTSMVIHNLQGPLAALISSLETLRGDGQLGTEFTDELLDIALTSGHKLYGRIESLLWIRRLEERRMPLNLQAVPLWSVVQPIVDEYALLAHAEGIELRTSLPEDLALVVVDEEIIGRVFSNLLDNALKFVPKGGEILVDAALESGPDGPVALCTVADTGPGISDSLKEVLFEKFRRGEPSPRGRRRGMGIGLHYCKVAVEAHHGSIWVEKQNAQGSTFHFTLPVAVDQAGVRR